ncbi:hypothetical protein PSACC_00271 [Paramicrosporidium saccamoebae]|uniref:Uncharacterized protein n=1 Tax=Paramicrosporidium saccamoebae TaxID=1246581 RepID=A0A2H9TQ84_9FUNG|nr:hypothetical protein PSACC_00271 [Paramicrosporidium saccamoebae]
MVHLQSSSAELAVGDLSVEHKRTVCANGPYGVHDTLRNGLHSIAHDLAPRHPLVATLNTVVIKLQYTNYQVSEEDEQRRCTLGTRLLGAHITTRIMAEKSILGECTRLPGLPSSRLGLSIIEGSDETINVEDILNAVI